jgi:hypothetical protein
LDLELLLEVVCFLSMALRELALALGALGRFPRRLLVVLRFVRVQVGLLAVAAGLFAQAFAFEFTLRPPAPRRHGGEEQEDYDNDDNGDDQSS